MRALSATGLARREAATQRLTWLLTLEAGGRSWRLATRDVNCGGWGFMPWLAGVESWREATREGVPRGGMVRSQATVKLLTVATADRMLLDALTLAAPFTVAATLRLAWLGETGMLNEADAAVMLKGYVSSSQRGVAGGLTLELTDELEALMERPATRILTEAMMAGEPSPSLGGALPWVFGRVDEAELVPLRSGVTTRLAISVGTGATLLPIESAVGLPAQGVAQVGPNVLGFNLQFDSFTGHWALAVTSGAVTGERYEGSLVRVRPADGFEWLVADHPCNSIDAIVAAGVAVPPTEWTVAERQLGGQTVQVVRMMRWPVGESGAMVRELKASVAGFMDESGAVVENPAEVLTLLLTHPRLGGLAAGRLDLLAFGAMTVEHYARGYGFARRLNGGESLGRLLDEAAREAGVWLGGGALVRLAPAGLCAQSWRVAERLDERGTVAPAGALEAASPTLSTTTVVELVREAGGGVPQVAVAAPLEGNALGVPPERHRLHWLRLDSEPSASETAERVAAIRRGRSLKADLACLPGAALLQAGDAVAWREGRRGIGLAGAWVRAVEFKGEEGLVRLKLVGPAASETLWRADAANHIFFDSVRGEIVITLGGRKVALLSVEGNLAVAGEVREVASIPGGPFTGAVALSGGSLYLNVRTTGAYWPGLQFDPAGGLTLAGELSEASTRLMTPNGLALGADEGRCWLAADPADGSMEYIAVDKRLYLRGTLCEGAAL